MHRLTGEILFKAGKILEAEESFKNALKILNCKLPRSSVAQSFKLIYEKLKKLHYRSRQFQIPEKRKLDRLHECINCLSFLWKINCMRGRLRSASLAITMEISLAFQSTSPFKVCTAGKLGDNYCLSSDFTQHFGKSHFFTPLVLHLNAYLHHLTGRKTLAQDLFKEALVLCEKQGNLLDQKWIRQSQVDCSGACSHTPAEWSTAVLSMPRWDQA
ncbi:hypothetical protein AMELA_G00256230 [Ameiurus melas]|uniref:Uncharacterized protein n=1 Tax=Ameiurus melas TaxID=219545 RepID=A0A7J5ZRC9_AMEME|nr:hypothetical protein AMELA_G00256230 [Ameiurus melas]